MDRWVAGLLTQLRRLQEVGAAIRQTFEPVIMTQLYPRSEIAINVSVLSADGGEYYTGYSTKSTLFLGSSLHPSNLFH